MSHSTRCGLQEVTMNCIHCQGQMKRSNAPFYVDRNGYHLVFDTVPACRPWISKANRSSMPIT